MKLIYQIAKTELKTLFFSPVAWLVLVVFALQTGLMFSHLMGTQVERIALGYEARAVTTLYKDLFSTVQGYLYLYIPLLTMGLMSRELGNSTIKLLYSSPINNLQIIMGKYFSMMLFGLILTGILVIYVLFGLCTIVNMDLPFVLCGLLGLYLLLCAYAAIGLFMSNLTSYQVIAAMGTLAVLAILNYVQEMGQSIDFVRDLTYWLSIRGRANEFIQGLLCSEDILYFLIVIVLFLTWTVLHSRYRVKHCPGGVRWSLYCGVLILAVSLGYFSSRPQLMCFYDTTYTQKNSLSKHSQEIISKIKGKTKITTFTNLLDADFWKTLPENINDDIKYTFRPYLRFKPDIELEYIYFYADAHFKELDEQYPELTDKERAQKIANLVDINFSRVLSLEEVTRIADLSEEGYRTTRFIEGENGKQTFLRFYNAGLDHSFRMNPDEPEISGALRRLALPAITIGFTHGHGERNIYAQDDRNFSYFSGDKWSMQSMLNKGFEVEEIELKQPIPETIDILVISALRHPLNEQEMANVQAYIKEGKNLVVLGDPGCQKNMNPLIAPFHAEFMPGQLVHPTKDYAPDLIACKPTQAGLTYWPALEGFFTYNSYLTLPGCTAIRYTSQENTTVIPLFRSGKENTWNELTTQDFINETPVYEAQMGEETDNFATVIALTRETNGKEQRVLIVGDSDCWSNEENNISRKGLPSMNYTFVYAAFNWLSFEELPVSTEQPSAIDNHIRIEEKGMEIASLIFYLFIPIILALTGILIWIRRRGK